MHRPHVHPDRAASPSVTIRNILPKDLPTLFDFNNDPEACAMAMVKPRTREVFDQVWEKVFADLHAGTPGVSAKAIIADGLLAGSIGCFIREGRPFVGYGIGKPHWGRGIATRALALMLADYPTRPLHAQAAASNAASIHVLTRNGFVITSRQMEPETDRYLACETISFRLDRSTVDR